MELITILVQGCQLKLRARIKLIFLFAQILDMGLCLSHLINVYIGRPRIRIKERAHIFFVVSLSKTVQD